MTATSFLREAFRADRVGIWHVDLRGTGSYCLADSPAPPGGFHDYAIGHLLVGELRRTGALSPIQGADGGPIQGAAPVTGCGGYCLAIPLHVSDRHVRTVAICRAQEGYTPREILLAGSLQPILGGIWTVVPEAVRP
ncbi:MAG TPA: hypothetical protein VHZ03_30780 [Trebonia sp.]|nr:hypothetical protein [Trebonia sp.]